MERSGRGKWLTVSIAACMVVAFCVAGGASAKGLREGSSKQQRDSVTIGADKEFNPANGVRSGSGTRNDPYVISGWEMDTLDVHDTDKYLVIRDNNITGTLILDWIGDRVTVMHNEIGDLRVNQNVKRTGDMTSGAIVHNTFGVVGQLRHYDGVFAYNVVGSPDQKELPLFAHEAVNFDGFNGAHFHDNTIYGFVDARLHGHHHSSGFGKPSHNHAYDADHESHMHHSMEMVDHTQRYDEVFIYDNKIYSSGPFALRYNDVGHSANDRTAPSETDPALNQPHVHHTRVYMTGNKLYGSGLAVEVFNADDENHVRFAPGLVVLENNEISLTRTNDDVFSTVNGISVHAAQVVTVRIANNTVTETAPDIESVANDTQSDAGIYLDDIDDAQVYLTNNHVSDMGYGILARQFTKSVEWWVDGLSTSHVTTPVYYDNSVANHPHGKP